MKNHLFFLATLFGLVKAEAQTSVYHPFPDSGAVWNFSTGQWCGIEFGFDGIERYYSCTISDDTIINSVNYHKLIVPFEVLHSDGMCNIYGTWTVSGHYAGSIRQDTANRKVFFVQPASTTEVLLYDFNMQIGDTVQGMLSPGYAVTIDSIDSVLVGGSYRKRWLINSTYHIYLIEGVGSTHGLVVNNPGTATDMYSYTLTCFKQNNAILYPNNTSSCVLMNCNAFFSLYPDGTTQHNWLAVSNISGIPPFYYLWSWGDGSTDTAAYPSHAYDSAGYHTICVTITDNEGCTSSYCDSFAYFAQMVTINVTNSIPIGILPLIESEKTLTLFPNPANQSATVEYSCCITSPNTYLLITDLAGTILSKIKIEDKQGKVTIETSDFSQGIYLCSIVNSDVKFKTQKLVIIK